MGSRVVRALVGGAICLFAGFAAIPAQAAFPGSNGRIAFDSDAETCGSSGCPHRLYSMQFDGSGLSPFGSAGETPAWSPDGSRLAFASPSVTGADVFVLEPNGTRVQLTDNSPFVFDGQPAWSPDGSKIAFVSSRSDRFEIYVMNADGSDVTRLTDSRADGVGLHATEPAWSPDGSRIAFTRTIGGGFESDNEIYDMKADGTDLHRLTFNFTPNNSTADQADVNPNWSPDGSRIVFASDRGPAADDIYSMNADGGDLVQLTERPTPDFEPAFSPDGTKVTFAGAANGPRHVFVMNADGSDETDLTPTSSADHRNPDWQPIPPRRSDFKNASHYCKALRDFLGDAEFSQRYENHGACVSSNH